MPALQVEHGDHEADAILGRLGHHREVVGRLGQDLADHLAVLEAQHGLVLPGDHLHLGVLRQAAHVEPADAAVARGAHDAAHQIGADAVVLVGLLDREGGFRLLAPAVAEAAQLGGAAHLAVDDMPVDEAAELAHAAGIVLDEGVGHGVRKAQAAAVLVQPQQVVAELVRFRRPQALRMVPVFGLVIAHDQTLLTSPHPSSVDRSWPVAATLIWGLTLHCTIVAKMALV